MHSMIRRLRHDDTGSALITALLATVIMLGLGLALLSNVDLQASQSSTERTRDRAFNLAEGVLNSEAFVLGRNWPATAPTPNNACGAAGMGFADSLGSTTATADTRITRLRSNLNASFTDAAYTGASWQVNVCDDVPTSTVWSDTNLNNVGYDYNGGTPNNKVWVRAQATVAGKTRAVAGLVLVRTTPALNPKYGLVSGGVKDDLGTVVNTLDNSVIGGVLTSLFGTTPTVAADPDPTHQPSGVTAMRCGALDLEASSLSTCVAGTIGALAAVPIVTNLVTGGKLEEYPTTTTATAASINQLRTQAIASHTYYSSSAGGTAASNTPCTFTTNTGTRDANAIVFIEKVGTGDQYCVLNVAGGVQYKALVIGSGRVILRGNGALTGTPTASTAPQTNTFSGVVYALNLQRLPTTDGGLGLGDAASPGREVVVIDSGAHVKGGVNADGRSGKVTITPPALSALDMTRLRNDVCNPLPLVTKLLCFTLGTVSDLLTTLGIPQTSVVTALLNQLSGSERAAYGSAIVSDVAAINKLTVFGASGVVPSSFHELTAN